MIAPAVEQKYAISEWHDTDKILAQLDALVAQPMRPIRREKMAEYLTYFDDRCVRSRELTDRAKALIPGDRLMAGLQASISKYNLPYVTYNQGSIVHLESSGVMLLDIMDPQALPQAKARKFMMEEMGAAFMAEGIISLAGCRLYTSLADSDDVIDSALARFDNVLSNVEGV